MTPSPHQSELNKRLRDIFDERDGYIHKTEANELAIAKIHQAYKDAGYLKVEYASNSRYEPRGFMTGQEWYERFEKEADSCTHYWRSLFRDGYPGVTKADYREMFVKLDILEAAQRAAGLTDE